MSARTIATRVFTSIGLAVALAVAIAAPASADTSDFTFDSMDVAYTLSQAPDGTSHLEVVETIVARFPDIDQNRGILRAIPRVNQGIDLDPVVHSVVDENGTDVFWEEYGSDDEFVVLALGTDEFVHGPTTYVISYSLDNVVTDFTDPEPIDELYWDVNGTGWDQPFGRVSATLTVDPSAAALLTGATSCFSGAYGVTDECTLAVDGAVPAAAGESVTYSTSVTDLDARETLTIVVAFPAATFVQGPVYESQYGGGEYEPIQPPGDAPFWARILYILLGLGAIGTAVGAGIQRFTGSKGAKGRGIIIPQYTVPPGLNVMVAAHIAGRESTAFAAQLVSLAVRKKLRILDYPVTASGADYTLQYLSADDLDPLELELMNALFGNKLDEGEVKELAPADVTLGNAVRAVTTNAKAAEKTQGYRTAQSGMGCLFPGIAFLLFFLTLVIGIGVSIATYSISPIAFGAGFLAFIALIVTIALLSKTSGPLTQSGAETREYLEGMKMYLELAEKERFRLLQSPTGAERIDVGDTKQIIKLYEKLLPFAVIWGVEDQWMRELVVHAGVDETPDWFRSTNGFTASSFTSALHGATNAATYAPPPPPSSSSWGGSGSGGSSFSSFSGGSGGGGFSGGGGGGGGGGGR
jgi:uncharacterized membrane protein YgcG